MYNLLIENKELLKFAYGLIIAIICFIIVLRADKLFKLSLHQGIRYFRNAFFFYGIAFIIRYFCGAFFCYNLIPNSYNFLTNLIFEYFLIIAGFFLLYSLLWKRIESQKEENYSSLLNARIFVFYIMALILVLLDFIWQTYHFMFISQVVLFLFASIISYSNYLEKGNKHKFTRYYFIAMLLSFVAWLLNSLAALYFNWNQNIIIGIYCINIIIFLLFLWGVIRVTKR